MIPYSSLTLVHQNHLNLYSEILYYFHHLPDVVVYCSYYVEHSLPVLLLRGPLLLLPMHPPLPLLLVLGPPLLLPPLPLLLVPVVLFLGLFSLAPSAASSPAPSRPWPSSPAPSSPAPSGPGRPVPWPSSLLSF